MNAKYTFVLSNDCLQLEWNWMKWSVLSILYGIVNNHLLAWNEHGFYAQKIELKMPYTHNLLHKEFEILWLPTFLKLRIHQKQNSKLLYQRPKFPCQHTLKSKGLCVIFLMKLSMFESPILSISILKYFSPLTMLTLIFPTYCWYLLISVSLKRKYTKLTLHKVQI